MILSATQTSIAPYQIKVRIKWFIFEIYLVLDFNRYFKGLFRVWTVLRWGKNGVNKDSFKANKTLSVTNKVLFNVNMTLFAIKESLFIADTDTKTVELSLFTAFLYLFMVV